MQSRIYYDELQTGVCCNLIYLIKLYTLYMYKYMYMVCVFIYPFPLSCSLHDKVSKRNLPLALAQLVLALKFENFWNCCLKVTCTCIIISGFPKLKGSLSAIVWWKLVMKSINTAFWLFFYPYTFLSYFEAYLFAVPFWMHTHAYFPVLRVLHISAFNLWMVYLEWNSYLQISNLFTYMYMQATVHTSTCKIMCNVHNCMQETQKKLYCKK